MKTSNLVEKILAYGAVAPGGISPRDSDKELIIRILQYEGANLTPNQMHRIRQTNFESIRRVRQKLQAEGKYLPSPEVAKQRRLKSQVIEQNAPTAKPEYLGDLLERQSIVTQAIKAQPKAIDWMKDE